MLKINEKLYSYAAGIVFCVVALLIVATFRHYGITWDEELQSQYGQAIVDYYLSGFKDQRYAEIYNLYLYGGMFDGLASAVDRFAPFTIFSERLTVYDIRHFVNALFGLLGMWGTWRLGRFIGGGAVALLALILLALTPMYYGHMFNNPKDIPFAAGIIWTLYYMSRFYQRAEGGHTKKLIVKLGIILGLTLGIRVGGVMVLVFWAMGMLVHPFRRHIRPNVINIFCVGALAYLVMLLCWPWAQQSPIANPLAALNEFKNFPHNVEVLLDGTIYMSTQLPWYYVPLYFAVQLPEILLFLLLASFALMPWIARGLNTYQRQTLLLILLTAFVPPLYAILRHPSLYDGVRHFLFVVPLMCILASLAARHIFIFVVGQFQQDWARRTVAAGMLSIVLIAAVAQITISVKLHPYEYIFANRFTGGVSGAYGRYELDYWGTSFKEAAEKLQQYVRRQGGVPPGKIYRVAICGPWDSAMIYLPPNYEPVVANEPAEFFLSTTRWKCQNMRAGKEIIRIKRFGVPLSIVKKTEEP